MGPRMEKRHTLDPRWLACPGLAYRPIQGRTMQKFGSRGKVTKGRQRKMPACLAGAFVLIFGGYMKCLKASCFSLQAITSWSIFCNFSLSICIYSNAKGDRMGRHSAPPASGNIIALVTWLPAVGGEARSFPGRGEGGFPGPGLQQPRKRDSQKAHSVRSFPE